jgi:septal ring factor EnvC (AmiA/AmiB activator)
MEEKNIIRRTSEDLRKVIKEQAKGFKRIHKILEKKTNLVCELRKEIVGLNGRIKELEIENKRLRND